MRRLALLVMVAAAVLVSPALAQRDCGNGLPCGNIPWSFPRLPVLPSPTPMPTAAITAIAPTQVSGAIPTAPPAPTNPALATVDTAGINDSVATLNAVMASTPMLVVNASGTPVDMQETFDELGSNSGMFFGYARTVSTVSFGQMTPLIAFAFLSLSTVFIVKLLTFMLPLIAAVFGLIRKIVQVILDFIPL